MLQILKNFFFFFFFFSFFEWVSSVDASRKCRTDDVRNTSSKLVHWCLLGICCLATDVVYRVYMLQY
jgi:hypothetical protein